MSSDQYMEQDAEPRSFFLGRPMPNLPVPARDADLRERLSLSPPVLASRTSAETSSSFHGFFSYKSVVEVPGMVQKLRGREPPVVPADHAAPTTTATTDPEEELHLFNLWSLDNRRLFVYKQAAQSLREHLRKKLLAAAGRAPGTTTSSSDVDGGLRDLLEEHVDLYVPVKVHLHGINSRLVGDVDFQKTKFTSRTFGAGISMSLRTFGRDGREERRQEMQLPATHLSPYMAKRDRRLLAQKDCAAGGSEGAAGAAGMCADAAGGSDLTLKESWLQSVQEFQKAVVKELLLEQKADAAWAEMAAEEARRRHTRELLERKKRRDVARRSEEREKRQAERQEAAALHEARLDEEADKLAAERIKRRAEEDRRVMEETERAEKARARRKVEGSLQAMLKKLRIQEERLKTRAARKAKKRERAKQEAAPRDKGADGYSDHGESAVAGNTDYSTTPTTTHDLIAALAPSGHHDQPMKGAFGDTDEDAIGGEQELPGRVRAVSSRSMIMQQHQEDDGKINEADGSEPSSSACGSDFDDQDDDAVQADSGGSPSSSTESPEHDDPAESAGGGTTGAGHSLSAEERALWSVWSTAGPQLFRQVVEYYVGSRDLQAVKRSRGRAATEQPSAQVHNLVAHAPFTYAQDRLANFLVLIGDEEGRDSETRDHADGQPAAGEVDAEMAFSPDGRADQGCGGEEAEDGEGGNPSVNPEDDPPEEDSSFGWPEVEFIIDSVQDSFIERFRNKKWSEQGEENSPSPPSEPGVPRWSAWFREKYNEYYDEHGVHPFERLSNLPARFSNLLGGDGEDEEAGNPTSLSLTDYGRMFVARGLEKPKRSISKWFTQSVLQPLQLRREHQAHLTLGANVQVDASEELFLRYAEMVAQLGLLYLSESGAFFQGSVSGDSDDGEDDGDQHSSPDGASPSPQQAVASESGTPGPQLRRDVAERLREKAGMLAKKHAATRWLMRQMGGNERESQAEVEAEKLAIVASLLERDTNIWKLYFNNVFGKKRSSRPRGWGTTLYEIMVPSWIRAHWDGLGKNSRADEDDGPGAPEVNGASAVGGAGGARMDGARDGAPGHTESYRPLGTLLNWVDETLHGTFAALFGTDEKRTILGDVFSVEKDQADQTTTPAGADTENEDDSPAGAASGVSFSSAFHLDTIVGSTPTEYVNLRNTLSSVLKDVIFVQAGSGRGAATGGDSNMVIRTLAQATEVVEKAVAAGGAEGDQEEEGVADADAEMEVGTEVQRKKAQILAGWQTIYETRGSGVDAATKSIARGFGLLEASEAGEEEDSTASYASRLHFWERFFRTSPVMESIFGYAWQKLMREKVQTPALVHMQDNAFWLLDKLGLEQEAAPSGAASDTTTKAFSTANVAPVLLWVHKVSTLVLGLLQAVKADLDTGATESRDVGTAAFWMRMKDRHAHQLAVLYKEVDLLYSANLSIARIPMLLQFLRKAINKLAGNPMSFQFAKFILPYVPAWTGAGAEKLAAWLDTLRRPLAEFIHGVTESHVEFQGNSVERWLHVDFETHPLSKQQEALLAKLGKSASFVLGPTVLSGTPENMERREFWQGTLRPWAEKILRRGKSSWGAWWQKTKGLAEYADGSYFAGRFTEAGRESAEFAARLQEIAEDREVLREGMTIGSNALSGGAQKKKFQDVLRKYGPGLDFGETPTATSQSESEGATAPGVIPRGPDGKTIKNKKKRQAAQTAAAAATASAASGSARPTPSPKPTASAAVPESPAVALAITTLKSKLVDLLWRDVARADELYDVLEGLWSETVRSFVTSSFLVEILARVSGSRKLRRLLAKCFGWELVKDRLDLDGLADFLARGGRWSEAEDHVRGTVAAGDSRNTAALISVPQGSLVLVPPPQPANPGLAEQNELALQEAKLACTLQAGAIQNVPSSMLRRSDGSLCSDEVSLPCFFLLASADDSPSYYTSAGSRSGLPAPSADSPSGQHTHPPHAMVPIRASFLTGARLVAGPQQESQTPLFRLHRRVGAFPACNRLQFLAKWLPEKLRRKAREFDDIATDASDLGRRVWEDVGGNLFSQGEERAGRRETSEQTRAGGRGGGTRRRHQSQTEDEDHDPAGIFGNNGFWLDVAAKYSAEFVDLCGKTGVLWGDMFGDSSDPCRPPQSAAAHFGTQRRPQLAEGESSSTGLAGRAGPVGGGGGRSSSLFDANPNANAFLQSLGIPDPEAVGMPERTSGPFGTSTARISAVNESDQSMLLPPAAPGRGASASSGRAARAFSRHQQAQGPLAANVNDLATRLAQMSVSLNTESSGGDVDDIAGSIIAGTLLSDPDGGCKQQ